MGTVLTSYLQILALCTYVRTYFLQRDPLWSSLSRQGLYPCFSLLLWGFTKFFAGQLIPGPPYRHVFFNRFNCFSFNPSPISGGACEQIAALRYCRVVLSIYEECTIVLLRRSDRMYCTRRVPSMYREYCTVFKSDILLSLYTRISQNAIFVHHPFLPKQRIVDSRLISLCLLPLV